jgi:hypothetical protein
MKTILITIAIILGLTFIFLAFVKKSLNDTEMQEYEVLKTYSDFEVRKYAPALYSSVKFSSNSYSDISGKGFRTLAGYIFGGNETQEQIAMTSPVTMEFQDTSKMMFMVPKGMTRESLPKPNNEAVYFEEYPERVVAAITFGGWVNDEKLKKYTLKLVELLEKEGLKHKGNFAYLGYNPPYDVINRRNEVIVELEGY